MVPLFSSAGRYHIIHRDLLCLVLSFLTCLNLLVEIGRAARGGRFRILRTSYPSTEPTLCKMVGDGITPDIRRRHGHGL